MSVSTPTSTSTITELRAVKTGAPVLVAHYDLPGQDDLFVAHALELNDNGYATYYTINPLRREVANGLGQEPKTGCSPRSLTSTLRRRCSPSLRFKVSTSVLGCVRPEDVRAVAAGYPGRSRHGRRSTHKTEGHPTNGCLREASRGARPRRRQSL
jgi:hypothetical protein